MVLGSGTKDKAMGTLCLLWPSQSPGLLKARLPEAQGGAGSSLPILVSHQAGPIMVPCIAAQRLGCPAPFLIASISPSGRESPLPCPVVHRAGSMPAGTSGGGGGQTVNYVKDSICGSYWCCWADMKDWGALPYSRASVVSRQALVSTTRQHRAVQPGAQDLDTKIMGSNTQACSSAGASADTPRPGGAHQMG